MIVCAIDPALDITLLQESNGDAHAADNSVRNAAFQDPSNTYMAGGMSARAIKWCMSMLDSVECLTASQRAILTFLSISHNEKTNLCCPSRETISKRLRIRIRRVSDDLKALKQLGVIGIEKVRSSGQYAHNSYILLKPKITPTRGQRGPMAPGVKKSPRYQGSTGAHGTRGQRGPTNKTLYTTTTESDSNIVPFQHPKTPRDEEEADGSEKAGFNKKALVE